MNSRCILPKQNILKHIPEKEKIALLSKAMKLAEQTQYQEGIANSAELLSSVYDRPEQQGFFVILLQKVPFRFRFIVF